MPTITEVENFVFALPENERAVLATRLLQSLPAILDDPDEGTAEAMRRDADFDADPNFGMSIEEFRRKMRSQD